MENKKVAIIGGGHMDAQMSKVITEYMKVSMDEVIILDPADLKNNQQEINVVFDNPPIPYKAAPKLESFFGEKEFKCKGKHQYREVKTESDGYTSVSWICQCGRKL